MTPVTISYIVQGVVVAAAAIVSIVSFVFLIPLESVPAVAGVSILFAISYGISVVAWMIVVGMYAVPGKDALEKTTWLAWLNTNLIFLVLLPTTVCATAMNVTAIQNTRNLLAGQIA